MQSWMIGMVSGTIFAGWWAFLPPWPLCLILAAIAVASLFYCHSVLATVVGGFACGCCLGLIYGTMLLQTRLADECVGEALVVTGRVSSLPSESRMTSGDLRQRFEFAVDSIVPLQCSGPTKLLLSYYGDQTIDPGDQWRFAVKLKKPWGLANPGSFNMQIWFAQRGIDGVGSVRNSGVSQRLPRALTSAYALHHNLRQAISERIDHIELMPEVAGILRAITVADKSGIDHSLWFLFQQFGINHLLVISGLHIGMVAGVGYLVGGGLLRAFSTSGLLGSWMPGVLALLLACVYSALAGFSLPTQRALCMLCCFVVADIVGRKSGVSRNLLVAAALVLLINPLAALGSGFWLSFGAVAALLWFAKWQHGMGVTARLFHTHGFMALMMLPMGALFFGGGSLVAMFANLLMIPLIGMVVVPLSLLAIVSYLCGWPVESILWQLAGWPLEHILPLAHAISDMEAPFLYVPLSADLFASLLGVVAVVLLILPGQRLLRGLALLLGLPVLLPPLMSSPTPSLETHVAVLDVGQGTAVVVRSGDRTLIYDTGGGDPDGVNMASMVVLPYLQQIGVKSLETLVVSHADLDHSAGQRNILEAMPVDRFRYGGKNTASATGRPCIAGESWRWPGGQVFQFLSPGLGASNSRNDSSCVLQIQIGDHRMLLPGDVQNRQEADLVRFWGRQLDSNWLLAAHHGSKTSSSPAFLKWVQPDTAVISAGYANPFGHPHSRVIQRLQKKNITIYSTASDGALEFEVVPGQALAVRAYRKRVRRYWM